VSEADDSIDFNFLFMSSAWVNARLAAFTPVGRLPLLLGVVPGLASMVGVAALSVLGVGCGAGAKVDGV
jgi:hypothetical protein